MKVFAFVLSVATVASTSAFVSVQQQKTSCLSMNIIKNHYRELGNNNKSENNVFANLALVSLFSLSLLSPLPAFADGQTEKFKLPPIDVKDQNRCTLTSSSIGQANAARDKLYDLRQCNLSGSSARGFDLSGVIMTNTDVSKVNFQEAQFSKAYLHGTII
jgi:uncharacterized protein YjbI with pentapeptide repeats